LDIVISFSENHIYDLGNLPLNFINLRTYIISLSANDTQVRAILVFWRIVSFAALLVFFR